MLGLAEAGQVGVNGSGDGTLVAEVDLDLTEVLTLLKQVRGIRVAQGVDVGLLLDATGFESETKGALQGGAAHGLGGRGAELTTVALGGKEQRGVAMGFPLLTQQLQRALGQGNVAILIPLAGADVQEHPLGVNVADLEPQAFAQTQAAGVDADQTDAVVQEGHASQETAHFGGAQDDRQFELGIGTNQLDLGGPGTLEGFLPEEFDGAEGLGGGLAGDLLDGLEVKEVLAELLGRDLIGGLGEEVAELTDAGVIGLFGAGSDGKELQVVGEGIKDGVRGAFFICMTRY